MASGLFNQQSTRLVVQNCLKDFYFQLLFCGNLKIVFIILGKLGHPLQWRTWNEKSKPFVISVMFL